MDKVTLSAPEWPETYHLKDGTHYTRLVNGTIVAWPFHVEELMAKGCRRLAADDTRHDTGPTVATFS